MTSPARPTPAAQAQETIAAILRAARSWAAEAPAALEPAIRAVCIRLAEMVADQRHYLVPLPEPQESERAQTLNLIAEQLRGGPVTKGIEHHLTGLTELELRSTASWAIHTSAQHEWVNTAVAYLEQCSRQLPADQQPDPYFADDVVAGIIASVRGLIGIDELTARTGYGAAPKRELPPDDA
jgi:hypothetical protein